ncbi:MAG: cyclase family protein [Anaerolineae bacterium]
MPYPSNWRVVDLTRTLHPGAERFRLDIRTYFVDELLPGFRRPAGDWYVLQEWGISSHIGTHVESPYHHLQTGGDVSAIAIDTLMGEAVVLDFRGKQGGEAITLSEVVAAGSDIRAGDIVIVQTGFDRLYGQPNYSRPYLSLEAIQWLVDRGMAAIGIDASGIEAYQAPEQPGHLLLFEHGIPVIEELAHLEELRQRRSLFIGLPLPIVGADSCPIRAVAIEGVTSNA